MWCITLAKSQEPGPLAAICLIALWIGLACAYVTGSSTDSSLGVLIDAPLSIVMGLKLRERIQLVCDATIRSAAPSSR
jgi:hypothetical protein